MQSTNPQPPIVDSAPPPSKRHHYTSPGFRHRGNRSRFSRYQQLKPAHRRGGAHGCGRSVSGGELLRECAAAAPRARRIRISRRSPRDAWSIALASWRDRHAAHAAHMLLSSTEVQPRFSRLTMRDGRARPARESSQTAPAVESRAGGHDRAAPHAVKTLIVTQGDGPSTRRAGGQRDRRRARSRAGAPTRQQLEHSAA